MHFGGGGGEEKGSKRDRVERREKETHRARKWDEIGKK